jgi:hypothetical protein
VALDSGNVRVGVTGVVYVAPLGTTLPTSATTTPAGGFTDVGYISDAGVTQSIAEDITDIQAWQLGTVVRRVQTSHSLTFQFEFLETNATTLAQYYGTYASGVASVTGVAGARQSWIIHVDDGTSDIRVVIPEAEISERGDTSYVNGEAVRYPVTLSAYPDDSGVKAYIYHVTGS